MWYEQIINNTTCCAIGNFHRFNEIAKIRHDSLKFLALDRRHALGQRMARIHPIGYKKNHSNND